MTSPGEVMAQQFEKARRALAPFSPRELYELRGYFRGIARNEKYRLADEMMHGLTAQGKVEAIDHVLGAYER